MKLATEQPWIGHDQSPVELRRDTDSGGSNLKYSSKQPLRKTVNVLVLCSQSVSCFTDFGEDGLG